ncbi:microsomal signal peptidase 25 kDa subunit-domain-containing protein [Xylariales sp. PMI_506]|nr:microsomal signal peptidase 25 kDa subunit-domain-containing protein [Xylariales sp. PMI_506]
MSSQEKISVYNLADLKNTSDDAIPNYLNSLKFKQSHTLVDVRLALGYSSFAVAAACFAWDYKLGFDKTKYWTAAAVAVYMIISTVLTYWIGFVEKGIVYQGVAPGGDKISIATSTKKNVPIYNLKITVTSKAGKIETIEISRPFSEWFDSAGHLIATPFQTLFATGVPLIAKADPKRGPVKEAKPTPAPAPAPAMDSSFVNVDATMLDALAASASTGADSSSGTAKKSKRRKA